jgi:hypothetical protein
MTTPVGMTKVSAGAKVIPVAKHKGHPLSTTNLKVRTRLTFVIPTGAEGSAVFFPSPNTFLDECGRLFDPPPVIHASLSPPTFMNSLSLAYTLLSRQAFH